MVKGMLKYQSVFYKLFRYYPRILAATQFTTKDREGKVAARRELTNGTGHGA